MADKINLLRLVSSLDIAPQFADYSKVRIIVSDDTAVEAGDDTGRTLEVTNPFGTQAMAQKMLNSLRGYQYQPYYAKGALLDPAAEIGDGITIKNTYGGLYQRERDFGRLMKADIAAPHDEEINHEYKYESPTERKFTRQIGEARASIAITNEAITSEVTRATNAENALSSSITQTATEIRASVVAKTGGNNSSFGWSLTATDHSWYAGNTRVMRVSRDGLEVNGKVTATSGFIGSGTNGFTISARAIYNGMTSLNDNQHNGIYIGTDGIALGKGAFKVTSSGNVSARSMTLSGTLTFLNSDGTTAGTMSASDLRQGAARANSGYASWNGTTSTVNSNGSYWGNGGAAGTKFSNMADATASYPINASSLRVSGSQFTGQWFYFTDGLGNTRRFFGLLAASE